MRFYSTYSTQAVDIRKAVLQGQAEDGGLFIPEDFPEVDLLQLRNLSFDQMAFRILYPFFSGIPESDFKTIVSDAFNFPIRLEKIDKGLYILRLDLGPTFAFKDFGVRFLARVMDYFLKKEKKKITILTATSGDTGGAVANAFFGLKNIDVVILFPEKGITDLQRRQMTSLGGNIYPLAVQGDFDICQALVKKAFRDPELRKRLNLSSANSINIARLLPQIVYYFFAKIQAGLDDVIFIIPSGNFGNFTAGLYAQFMGLQAKRLIAAVNANDEFVRFMKTKLYQPLEHSISTLSNAMDIANPSNLIRIFYHFSGKLLPSGQVVKNLDFEKFEKIVEAESVDDDQTLETIRIFWRRYSYLPDPHTAVGLRAFEIFKQRFPESDFIVLQTANPIKFKNVVESAIGDQLSFSKEIRDLFSKSEIFTRIEADFEKLVDFLMQI